MPVQGMLCELSCSSFHPEHAKEWLHRFAEIALFFDCTACMFSYLCCFCVYVPALILCLCTCADSPYIDFPEISEKISPYFDVPYWMEKNSPYFDSAHRVEKINWPLFMKKMNVSFKILRKASGCQTLLFIFPLMPAYFSHIKTVFSPPEAGNFSISKSKPIYGENFSKSESMSIYGESPDSASDLSAG